MKRGVTLPHAPRPGARGRKAEALRLASVTADDRSSATTLVDDAESPLAWLHRRRDRDGEPMVSDEEFAAGERLRRDHARAGLTGGLRSNWREEAPVARSLQPGMADLTDDALAARLRVERALGAVGPDLAGVLVDVCCFLKGLETVEIERRWPARSGKLVLRLALRALARHYGPDQASGPGRSRLRHWGAEGYRPDHALPRDEGG